MNPTPWKGNFHPSLRLSDPIFTPSPVARLGGVAQDWNSPLQFLSSGGPVLEGDVFSVPLGPRFTKAGSALAGAGGGAEVRGHGERAG